MQYEILIFDLKEMFSDFRPQDFGPLVFWSIWLVALFSSLRGVDRRDEIAQVTYMGTLMALGVCLILVLPFGQHERHSPIDKLVVLSVVLLLPSLRWMFRKGRTDLDRVFSKEALVGKNKSEGGK